MARTAGVLLAFLLLARGWMSAHAWGKTGHQRINIIADSLLSDKKREKIKAMLKKDIVAISNLESKPKATNFLPLRFHSQNPRWTCNTEIGHKGLLVCDNKAAKIDSIFCAMAYFFDEFAHKELLLEFPQPDAGPIFTPRSIPGIVDQDVPEHVDLMWLINLLGDLHQPLHWFEEQNYGKDVNVIYNGQRMTLWDLWEIEIPQQLPKTASIETLQKDYKQFRSDWRLHHPDELFRTWAKEAAEKVCTEVNRELQQHHADGSTTIPDPFEVSEALMQRWVKVADKLMLEAGERTAFILRDILMHTKSARLHKEGRGMHHRHKNVGVSLAKNLGVGLVVVPGLIALFSFHLRIGGPTLGMLLTGRRKA